MLLEAGSMYSGDSRLRLSSIDSRRYEDRVRDSIDTKPFAALTEADSRVGGRAAASLMSTDTTELTKVSAHVLPTAEDMAASVTGEL